MDDFLYQFLGAFEFFKLEFISNPKLIRPLIDSLCILYISQRGVVSVGILCISQLGWVQFQ